LFGYIFILIDHTSFYEKNLCFLLEEKTLEEFNFGIIIKYKRKKEGINLEKPTEKQLSRIHRLVEYKGEDFVYKYFKRKFPEGDFGDLTKEQAQKIITGLQTYEDRKPVLGVVGRDVF